MKRALTPFVVMTALAAGAIILALLKYEAYLNSPAL